MKTIAEFALEHGFNPHSINMYVCRNNLSAPRERREIKYKNGTRVRTVRVLTPEDEKFILQWYRQPNARLRKTKPKKAQPEVMGQFEKYLVNMYKRLKHKATTEQIVNGCIEVFRTGGCDGVL